MNTLLAIFLASALLAAPLAGARDFRQGPGPRMQGQGQGQGQQAAQAKKAPQQPVRRNPEKKGAEHDKGHPNRLTDQERRDLKRDVDRADREIYRR